MEEHEYLQFLLRITEDIIINNYSKSEDIEDVFEHHIEINKERLNKVKMYLFIFCTVQYSILRRNYARLSWCTLSFFIYSRF